MKLPTSSEFHLWSWDIKQRKFRLSPFEQHGVPFTLVVAESDIFPVNVPVARLQFSDQCAFGYLPVPQKPVWTDIVGERGKEQTVTPELAEHGAELTQVFPQERVRLPLRHGATGVHTPHTGDVFPSASLQNTSYTELPTRKAAGGRLPPARPSPSDGCPVRTRSRPPAANRG